MQMTIVTNNLALSSDQRAHLMERATQAFQRLLERIDGITATFIDVNGPKGGRDTLCKLHIAVTKAKNIQVSATQENIFSAFAQALSKAKQLLKQRYARKKSMRYKGLIAKPLSSDGVETLAEHRWQKK